MEEIPEVQEDLGEGGKFKNWLQDNIRIILSVLIVVAIAAGIYSYSKRTEVPGAEELAMEESLEMEGEEEGAVTIIGQEEETDEEENAEAEEVVEETMEQPVENQPKEDVKVAEPQEKVVVSEETGDAFVETAQRGDSYTTLARKATRNYLEKNNDSNITAEHRVYIEDYLRRQVQGQGLHVGDQITFSKTMIKDAVEKAKTLTPNQLENLKKYSARVPGI